MRSLERRAARRLSRLPSDGVVDRSIAVRLALGLAALVVLACLYELLAPKSLLVSAARLVAPWAGIAAPSRVRIEPVRLEWRMPDEPPEEQAADTSRLLGTSIPPTPAARWT
ncbi:MAG: hypothetical protein EBZ59_02630 [Planctomycetia bacterium]|nr:hypothetical protein [Planctomycetia bacterium]